MAALFSSPSSYTSRGAARNPASAPTPVPRAEADLSVGMADTCCCALCVLLECLRGSFVFFRLKGRETKKGKSKEERGGEVFRGRR